MDVAGFVGRSRRTVAGTSAKDVLFKRRLLLAVAVFVALTIILATPDFFRVSGIVVGQPSPRTIKAPHSISFVDSARTAAQRQIAADRSERVYDVDPNAIMRVGRAVDAFFAGIASVSARHVPSGVKLRLLDRRVDIRMPRPLLLTAISLAPRELLIARTRAQHLVQTFLADKITADNIEAKRQSVRLAASEMDLPAKSDKLVGAAVAAYLEPTYVLNAPETARVRERAAKAVAPVIVRKQRGETIVQEGRIVSASDIQALREEGLVGSGVGGKQVLGYALIALAVVAAVGLYLQRYRSEIFQDVGLLGILAIIIVGFTLIVKAMSPFTSPYVLPFAAPAILACIILGGRVAVVSTLVITVMAFLVVPESALPVVVLMLGSLVGALMLSKIVERRSVFVGATIAVATIGYLAVTSSFISGLTLRESLLNGGYGLLGGLLGVVLGLGSLPFFESVFHVTTDIRLLELADPGQPLMRRLMLEAPGTYNHSMIVGNLAESAAPFVGANPLKARVGAYYHDIGKLKRPLFFIENQMVGQNPHDHTKPHLSCLIVTAHVKDGVDLAREHKIPEEIIDIIEEHHGTSVVTYFFQQAREHETKQEICEEDFRYGTERPRTREAALVMLADVVEAAARTMRKPTPGKLEHLTKKLIKARLEDGQLDESRLTLGDLEEISRHFAHVLTSIYHARIDYPEARVTAISDAKKAHDRKGK